MSLAENLTAARPEDVLWRTRKTDWFKLLHLPDVGWFYMLLAAACLVVVIWGILRFVSRANEDVDPAEADREMLQALNELHREGDLSEDEFRSIKGQIMGRLGATWGGSSGAGRAANCADHSGNQKRTRSETLRQLLAEQSGKSPATANSDQSETFTSPTHLSEPEQDTRDQSERNDRRESEYGDGNTESDEGKPSPSQ